MYRFSVHDIVEWNEEARCHERRNDVIISATGELGLYDLIDAAFTARAEFEFIDSHIFSASLAGTNYGGPFEGCAFEGALPCTKEDAVPFASLNLQVGASGAYKMESVTFEYKLTAIAPEEQQHAGRVYPFTEEAPAVAFTGAEAADHLTPAEAAAATQFGEEFAAAAVGNNTWVLVRTAASSTYVAGKYKPPSWTDHMGNSGHPLFQAHECMIGLLLRAGWSFAKAWKNVLQYAFLDRTKGASANRYIV